MKLSRLQTLGIVLLLALLAWVPLFYHLDQNAVVLWDESQVAVNAVEMCESGDLIVTTYQGKPDHWFVKPPLMVWAVAASMKVLGYQVLALRLPAVLAAMAVLYMLLWFAIRVLGDWRIGLFAGLALLTTRGFLKDHVARTGDVDMFLIAFLVLFWLAWFTYLYGPPALRNRSIWVSALGLGLAFMSKSTAAFFTLPALVMWMVYEKQALDILRNRRFYIAYVGAMLVPMIYYALREMADPGFVSLVWQSEFFGRFSEPSDGPNETFTHYFSMLAQDFLFPYIYALPLVLLLTLRKHKETTGKVVLASLGMVCFCLLLISVTAFKRDWYPAQIYPLVALMIGIGVRDGWVILQEYLGLRKVWMTVCALILFCVGAFGQNYWFILRQHSAFNKRKSVDESYGYAIPELHEAMPDCPPYAVATYPYNAAAYFYVLHRKIALGEEHAFINVYRTTPNTGSVLLCCDPNLNDSLAGMYQVDTLWETKYNCQLLRLNAR